MRGFACPPGWLELAAFRLRGRTPRGDQPRRGLRYGQAVDSRALCRGGRHARAKDGGSRRRARLGFRTSGGRGIASGHARAGDRPVRGDDPPRASWAFSPGSSSFSPTTRGPCTWPRPSARGSWPSTAPPTGARRRRRQVGRPPRPGERRVCALHAPRLSHRPPLHAPRERRERHVGALEVARGVPSGRHRAIPPLPTRSRGHSLREHASRDLLRP